MNVHWLHFRLQVSTVGGRRTGIAVVEGKYRLLDTDVLVCIVHTQQRVNRLPREMQRNQPQ